MNRLLDADGAREAVNVVREIAIALQSYEPAPDIDRPLMRLRRALFYANVDRAGILDGVDAAGHAEHELDLGLRLMATTPLSDRLHGGIAGVGYTLCDLIDEAATNQLCDPIDRHLLTQLEAPWAAEFELLRGLVGLGVYALRRYHREDGRRVAVRVLDHLEVLARRSDRGAGWLTTPGMPAHSEAIAEAHGERVTHGFYNLGVSHGNAGVLGVLARFAKVGIEPVRSAALLVQGVEFLLRAAQPRDVGRFPKMLDIEHREIVNTTRVAWCNGDFGISLTLLAAARALERSDWKAEALDLAHHVARMSLEAAGVVDSGLCHGAAGIAHGFHRIYRATGDAVARDAARAWIQHVLAMRRPEARYGGFASADRSSSGQLVWTDDATLLSGSIGVGLALLAAATGTEPDWDGVFLFDCGDWN